MQITSLNTTTVPTNAATATTATAPSNFNSFLQLLVTEVKNQDPTKPIDPTQTVTQLATFSQVQQSVQTNTTLDSLLSTSQLSQASALVGKTVTSQDGAATGKIASVTTSASSSTATLDNGTTIDLSAGIKVS